MFIKVARGAVGCGDLHDTPQRCDHVRIEAIYDGSGKDVGRKITVVNSVPLIQYQIPRDGHAVYFMNNQGDTANTLHWPLRNSERKKEKKHANSGLSPQARVQALRR